MESNQPAVPIATNAPATGGRYRHSRWAAALIAAGVLLALAWHGLSDPERLTHSGPLALADVAGYSVCHRVGQRSF
ncbi:MAG: hypothetical protein ACRDHL_10730, partial [Candidatus Promineifilaceae bacterium]